MSPRSAAEQGHRELGHSAEIQRILDGFSARWLCTCSRAFCGDLAMMQVLSAVALASLAGEEGAASLSASQIARRTRVPRQTVTRKLLAMADKGWVVRCPDGRWTLDRSTTPTKVSRDLGALWDSVTSLIAGLVADVTTSIEGRTAGHG